MHTKEVDQLLDKLINNAMALELAVDKLLLAQKIRSGKIIPAISPIQPN